MAQEPPTARQVPHITRIHGLEMVDPYFWMRDLKDPDTMAYLKAEDGYAQKTLASTQGLQETLYQEMLSRLQEEDQRSPYRFGDYGYFSKTEQGKSYNIFCRTPWGKSGPVEVLLDLNQLAVGQAYCAIGTFDVSPDGNWLAYGLDTTGYRQYKLHFKNLKTGKVSPEIPERVTSVCWAQDSKTVFFTTEDPVTKRRDKFWQHTVGQSESRLLWEEKDELFDIACSPSRDHKLVLIHSVAKTSSECLYLANDASQQKPKVLRPRKAGLEYSADFFENRFVIRTNEDSDTFYLVQASPEETQKWQPLLELPKGSQVDDFCLFPGRIAVMGRRDGIPNLLLFDPEDKKIQIIDFPEQVRSLYLAENEDSSEAYVRVEYESPVTPPTTYDVTLASGTLKKVRQKPVPNYQAQKYRCQRWMVKARDGVQVPVTLVYRADLKAGGSGHPTLLEGYGSYGSVDDPTFSPNLVSLLDRGVVYAYAHIRGGGELGEPWRQAGRMMRKKTTFHDFVDCGQALVDQRWSRKDGLAIVGGSAGGLLVGAASNERPQLFRAVISRVPFVDVMNTMLDETLPLTTSEYLEWGNPKEKPAFDYMMSYSPYDNLKAQAYPSMLVKVSINDSQVPYWEGAKYVAKLRSLKTDNNPVLLKVNFDAGHGGASGRYDRMRERAFDYAYLLWQWKLFAKP